MSRRFDVIVVGAGVAGLRTVLELAGRRVALVTKAPFATSGSSPLAQGGIAAAVGADDSPLLHAADTVAVAGGLADSAVVRRVVEGAAREIDELEGLGAGFDRDPGGELLLGREAGHGRRRIVHAGGDRTGARVSEALRRAVSSQPGVTIFERCFVTRLLTSQGRIVGVRACDGPGDAALELEARAVVLATGGLGQLYRSTTNPTDVTGDGIALATAEGALVADVEFVQFHPTALAVDGDPLPLLTEALRGAGARILDERGERFLPPLHVDAELAPRDLLARFLWRHQQEGHRTFLDLRARPGNRLAADFPTVAAICERWGYDPSREPLPITPAAHYAMGGVRVDGRGRTSLPGLWACGECASSGMHGANRLASNSLLEAMVLGRATAADLGGAIPPRRGLADGATLSGSWIDPSPARSWQRLREVMWDEVGLARDERGLERALDEIERLQAALPPAPSGLAHALVTARAVALAALAREETRGSHVRLDRPHTDPRLAVRRDLAAPPALKRLRAAS